MLFIKIKDPARSRGIENIFRKRIRHFLELIIPRANPDFENKIQLVVYWLIEFENKRSAPNREIGLGNDDEVILKMPNSNNSGYWTDNNLSYSDFLKSFEVEYVTREYFEQKWN